MTAPTSALAFRTGVVPGPVAQVPAGTIAIAAAEDGSFFSMDGTNLNSWDSQKGVTVLAAVTSNAPPYSQSLAAVSRGLVYCLGQSEGATTVLAWTADGGAAVSALPALPGNASPKSIGAAADGTLWAVGSDNCCYAYTSGSWSVLGGQPPGTVTMLSPGSAGFGVALVVQPGDGIAGAVLVQNGQWLPPMGGGTYVKACSDGSCWVYGVTLFHVTNAGIPDASFRIPDLQALPYAPVAAASEYGCYFVDGAALSLAACGVMDAPPAAWPVLTGTQQQAYDDISSTVGAVGVGGIREQYSNINAPVSEWYTQVTAMGCPRGVAASDWTIVQTQILSELESVTSVNSLFTNLSILADKVGLIQTDTYAEVVEMVGLPAQPSQQPTSLVNIILGQIYDEMIGAAMKAVPDEAAKAVNIGMTILKYAGDFIAKNHGAQNCDQAFTIACADLAGELANSVTSLAQTAGTLQSAILSDWGKLSACGAAINSGNWYWPPTFDYTVLASIGQPTRVLFYQTLMPAKWQIMMLFSYDNVPRYAPQYSFVAKTASDANGNAISWWYVCAAQGTDVDLTSQGPWPNKLLIDEISLNLTNMTDFFTGASGWSLPTVAASDWQAPITGLPWQPWVDSASPLG